MLAPSARHEGLLGSVFPAGPRLALLAVSGMLAFAATAPAQENPSGAAVPPPVWGIVNGYVPLADEWPWIARLDLVGIIGAEEGSMECGGILISATVVLTAAHCVTDTFGDLAVPPKNALVTLGRPRLTDESGGEQIRAGHIVVHERYTPIRHDVALLHLARPASAEPARFAGPSTWSGMATAMGWGRTATDDPSSNNLLAVDLPLIGATECEASVGEIEEDLELCAGGQAGDTCFGDSGGGLMVRDRTRGWLLLAITSRGKPQCALPGVPAIYAWVAGRTLRDWILARI
jgi:secreted trypsin-like serine protease